MDIILKGNPLSINHIYKARSFGKFISVYMTAEGKKLKKFYQEQAAQQFEHKPLDGELEIWVELYFGDKRQRDWDNYHKLSMDALTGIVWNDDKQIQVAHVSKFYDKENPRIELTIRELSV